MAVHAYQPELLASKPQSVSIEGPSLQKRFPWEFDPLATTELLNCRGDALRAFIEKKALLPREKFKVLIYNKNTKTTIGKFT